MSIPNYQIAATIERPRPGAKLDLRHDIPVPEPKAGEVLIKLECTGFWYLFIGLILDGRTVANKRIVTRIYTTLMENYP